MVKIDKKIDLRKKNNDIFIHNTNKLIWILIDFSSQVAYFVF